MAVSDAFRDYVVEQLAGLGAVTVRRMFGGAGLYHEGLFFGVLDDDQLFFRVDDATRPRYEAAGSGPFTPMPDREAPMRGYYEVPAALLDDRDELAAWARDAVAAAHAAKLAKRGASAPVRRRASASARGAARPKPKRPKPKRR
jgi:DNA transformation protein